MNEKPTPQNILAALSDEKTMKIFRLTATGLKGSKEVPEKLSISPKQYYSRLKKLVSLGLIEKKRSIYTHTILGTIVQNAQIKPLEEAIANYWHLKAVNELKKSTIIPREEQDRIIESLMKGTGLKEFFLGRPPSPIKIFSNFDELVEYGRRVIGEAKYEIFLASRYYDPIISQKLMDKFSEGVKLNLLDGNPEGTTLLNRLTSVLNADSDQKTKTLLMSFIRSPSVRIRNKKLDYSFFIIDGIHCGLECPDPINPHEFTLGIEFEDSKFAQRLIKLFEKLWETAEELRLKIGI